MFGAFKDVTFKWDVQLEPGMNQKAHHFFANGVAAKWAECLNASKTAEVRVASAWELPATRCRTRLMRC